MKKGRCLDFFDINRRKLLKLMAIAATGAVFPWRVAHGAFENLIENFSTKVCLTGVRKGSEDRVLIEAVRKVDEDSVPRDVKKQLSEMVSKPN